MIARIDWCQEFDRLAPRMRKEGGVLRIDHAGTVSAWLQFDSVLKQEFARLPGRPMSIRIDSHWHTTRFLADILREFDRKLAEVGLPPAEPAPAIDVDHRLSILSGNHVGGNAEMRIDKVVMYGDDPVHQVRQRDRHVESVCERIGALLDRGERAMVVVHQAPPGQQASFWRDLWRRGLHDLVARGMLLVYYVEEGMPAESGWPTPDEVIRLPRDLLDDTREGHAYEDLINLLEGMGMSKDGAIGAALAHLVSNKRSMGDFYVNLAWLMMDVRAGKLRSC